MSDNMYEYVQRIQSHYVGNDCIQIMVPHLGKSITILNSEEMTYHYLPNSSLFINKYLTDSRKDQFPYSKIPVHKKLLKWKKFEYINQLFDFNKIYISISDGCVRENYAVKDGNEALLATKILLPVEESTKIMNRSEVEALLKNTNNNIYGLDGSVLYNFVLETEKEILESYKNDVRKLRETEKYYTNCNSRDLDIAIKNGINSLTITDIPSDTIYFLVDRVLVFCLDGEIKSIKGVTISFDGPDRYKVEFADFPIIKYSLNHLKQLEQLKSLETKEPKINKFLNPNIDTQEINKNKSKVLTLLRAKKNN